MRPPRISHAIGRYDEVADLYWFVRHDASPAHAMLTADPIDAKRFPSVQAAIDWAAGAPGELKRRMADWPPIVIPVSAKVAGEPVALNLDVEAVM